MRLAPWVRKALAHRSLPVWLAAIACALLVPGLDGGFQLDDHFQRYRLLGMGGAPIQLFVFQSGDPEENAREMERGSLPWWTAPDFHHASLRYVAVLTAMLDQALWPEHPRWMHVHSLLWLGALVAAAACFYRTILGIGWVAGLAGLLYALDDAHALPAVYLANRNALLATFFGVLSLTALARGRSLHSAIFLALALASGEIALATAGYTLAHALVLQPGPLPTRVRALVPCAVVLAAWALAYVLGGFGSTHSGYYREPLADPVGYARAALERIPLLTMGQWTPIPSDYGSAVPAGSDAALVLRWIGLATLAVLAATIAPLVRRDPTSRFFALGAALSLLPIAAVGPQDRLLFFVGLGCMGLLAQIVAAALENAAPTRIAARVFAVALLAVHLVGSPIGISSWIDAHEAASERMLAAVASIPTDPSLTEQDLILVNPPDYVYVGTAIPVLKRLAGEPVPRRVRALAAVPSRMRITGIDAHTLRVELDPGLFAGPFTRYHRAAELRFAVGERIALSTFDVEITALNGAGDPRELVYRFDAPLGDPSLRWLVWREGRYAPWSPPPPGVTIQLPAPRTIFDSGSAERAGTVALKTFLAPTLSAFKTPRCVHRGVGGSRGGSPRCFGLDGAPTCECGVL